MSWVSILEDSIKRFEDSMHRAAKEMPVSPGALSPDEWKQLFRLLARGDRILYEASKCLELATDPSIDLAYKLRSAEADISRLNAQVSEIQKSWSLTKQTLNDREKTLTELKRAYGKLQKAYKALDEKLDAAMKAAPAAVYDQFSKGSRKSAPKN
jgi:septal ring factor EnvC (AmiA/AmiB activator)